MLLFPLPSFHIKFENQKEPASSAHLYALKPNNALTARMTIYASACSATGFFWEVKIKNAQFGINP